MKGAHMKRILIFFSLLLFSATFLFADEVLESQARNYWDSMPNHTDPDLLDECITKYPKTVYGKIALLTRYQLLVTDPSIEGYNQFLKQYPKTVQADCALQNLYDLCREYNKVPVWMDFLGRYPDTIQGCAAKLHVQTLMADYAFLKNDEEVFDVYIQIFPDAPQIPGILEQAAKLAQKQEEEYKAKILNAYGDDYNKCENELKKRANKIVVQWGKWFSDLHDEIEKVGQDKVMENGDTLVLVVQIRRYEKIILDYYSEYDAAREVRAEHRHQELLKKLDSIQQTLLDNHREMVKVIREESEKTRQTLREEFAKLGYKLDAGFEKLGQKMDVLHNDLVSVYEELQKVNQNLVNIHDAIQKGNELLAKIDNDLAQTNNLLVDVNSKLVDLDHNMNQQFDRLVNEVVDFKVQTVNRLNTVIENQDRDYQKQCEIYEAEIETLKVTKDIRNNQEVMIVQNDKLIDLAGEQLNALGRIEDNQGRQLEQLVGLRNDVGDLRQDVQNVGHSVNALRQDVHGLRQDVQNVGNSVNSLRQDVHGLRQDVRDGFERTNKNLAAGFAGVQRSIYTVGSQLHEDINRVDRNMRAGFEYTNKNIQNSAKAIIDSNNATYTRMQQAMQQAQQSSRSSNPFKRFLGGVARFGGAVLGGVLGGPAGAAFGGAIGNAAGTAIEGGNRKDIAFSAIEGGISGAIAGSSSDYKPPKASQMLDTIWDAGKNTLKEEISKQLGEKLPSEAKPLIESIARNGIEIEKQKAIQTMAEMNFKVEKSDVQTILQRKSLGEIWSDIEQISQKNGQKPDTVRFVMDYMK